jgi:hypothetical protein
MPLLGQTQYYTKNQNGQDIYITQPWGGNALPTYTPISKEQYTQGLQKNLQKAQDFVNNLNTGVYKRQGNLISTPNGWYRSEEHTSELQSP